MNLMLLFANVLYFFSSFRIEGRDNTLQCSLFEFHNSINSFVSLGKNMFQIFLLTLYSHCHVQGLPAFLCLLGCVSL